VTDVEQQAWTRLATLIRDSREAYLGTIDPKGEPYVSVAGFLPDWDGKGGRLWFLLSAIARHTKNLTCDGRSSVLLVDHGAAVQVQERSRATLVGTAVRLTDRSMTSALKARYIERYPQAAAFFELPDFSFWGFVPREVHWFGGFGTARTLIPESGEA
jgi:putative heme iron utilization protein